MSKKGEGSEGQGREWEKRSQIGPTERIPLLSSPIALGSGTDSVEMLPGPVQAASTIS